MFQISSKWSVHNERQQSSSCCSSGVTIVSIYKWLCSALCSSVSAGYECQTSRRVKHESIWLHKAHLSSTHTWCLCLLASNIWALRSCSICSHNPLLQGHRSWKQEKPWLSALLSNGHNVTMLTWLANTRISSYLKTHSRLGVIHNEKWLFILFLTA